MLNYFYEHQAIPEVSTICKHLDKLKYRISSGDYEDSYREYDECRELFGVIKEWAIARNDEKLANAQVIYKNYFMLFCHLSSYFRRLKEHKYKLSWNVLQDCFDDIKFVGKYLEIDARKELPDIYELLESYEKLYPYEVFISSEYIISKSHCSICGESMQSLACPHIKGNLYFGDIAVEIIDEIQEFQAACLVSHPEDKRCIFELAEDNRSEKEKFTKVDEYIAFNEPFLQKFSINTIMEIRERNDITKVGRNDPCSCGSGLKFKKCCGKNLFYQHERNIVIPKEIITLDYYNL